MRMLLAAAVIIAAISPVQAADTPQQASMKSCAATWKTMKEADKAKTKYTDYMGTCMKKAPETAAAAPGGTMMMAAKPKADAAYSMAMTAKPKAAASGSMMMAAPHGRFGHARTAPPSPTRTAKAPARAMAASPAGCNFLGNSAGNGLGFASRARFLYSQRHRHS
ncbi:MAG: hypothetical protein U1E93_02950 [Alphaproteobacteria bacterium]